VRFLVEDAGVDANAVCESAIMPPIACAGSVFGGREETRGIEAMEPWIEGMEPCTALRMAVRWDTQGSVTRLLLAQPQLQIPSG
jgi:hypothetical protein